MGMRLTEEGDQVKEKNGFMATAMSPVEVGNHFSKVLFYDMK